MSDTSLMLDQMIHHWIRPEIREIAAYPVPDASGMIKLDAMENPYTWPAELREQWVELLRHTDVNRYPSPRADALKERLAETMAVPAGMALLLGNGSDEIIQMLAMAVAGGDRTLLTVEPGFVMYRMVAIACGMQYRGVPLDQEYGLDLPALLQAIEQSRPALTFIAYPNNPTGNLFNDAALVAVLKASPGLVVIDEAYAPFTDASFMQRLGEFENLLVMRTLSKMGLAGLRLGLLAGPAAWLQQVDKVRLPYNINVLTQVSAVFALAHHSVLDQQARSIREQRAYVYQALTEIDGITAFPSEANFILLRVPPGRADALHAGLQQRRILVKKLHGAHPLLRDCLRVTVGTPEENQAFLTALRSLCPVSD